MRPRGEEKDKKGLSKGKKIIGIIIASGLLAIAGGGYYISTASNEIEAWNGKVYPGITVEGVDISGKTKEEAKKILEEQVLEKVKKKKIEIKVNEKKFSTKYSEINPSYDFDKAIEEAVNKGKEGGIFKKKAAINGNTKKEIKAEFKYDSKKLSELQKKIEREFLISPINAKMTIQGGKKNIINEKLGKKIDEKELADKLKKNINGERDKDTILEFSYVDANPKVTKSELSKINGIMGTFSSSFKSSDANRAANIIAAVGFVNGTVLMPGEEFSYDKATSTDKSKYKEGNVYINNEIKKDIGGGICQVSSALYRANMRANIRSTERYNHSLTVGYAKPSLDATVAWGYLDYKFKNPYDVPIYIEGKTDGKVITFNIYGDVGAKKGRTYEMESEIVRTIAPGEQIIKDKSLPRGKRVVSSGGQTGYVSKGYQVTYEKGKVIKRELVSTDNYVAAPRKVRVGV